MHLGEKLKAFKKQNNKDQEQMAELVGVSIRKYAQIERTGAITKVEDREKIEELLGLKKQISADLKRSYETKEDILMMLDKSLDANNRHADANKENASNLTELVKMLAQQFNLNGTGSAFSPLKEESKDPHNPVQQTETFVGKSRTRSPKKQEKQKGILKG